jgi:hypothetical protein
MDERTLQLLDEHDWTKTIFSLTAYVISLCRWKNIHLPRGTEFDDIAMQSIEKVYTGERQWDPDKNPDLVNYLKSVCRSLVSNELTASGAAVTPLEIESVEEPSADSGIEQELYYHQVNEEIALQIKDDYICSIIFKGFKDGMTLKEISEDYMIEIDKIRKGRRRLLTTAIRVTKQLSKGELI